MSEQPRRRMFAYGVLVVVIATLGAAFALGGNGSSGESAGSSAGSTASSTAPAQSRSLAGSAPGAAHEAHRAAPSAVRFRRTIRSGGGKRLGAG